MRYPHRIAPICYLYVTACYTLMIQLYWINMKRRNCRTVSWLGLLTATCFGMQLVVLHLMTNADDDKTVRTYERRSNNRDDTFLLSGQKHLPQSSTVRIDRTPVPAETVSVNEITVKQSFHKQIQSANTLNCTEWYADTFEENLDVIKHYPRGNADRYWDGIGGNRSQPREMMTSFPVIATAASAEFYGVSQGLIKSIHDVLKPKYGDIKIVYYDLGLTEVQVAKLKKHGACEVRPFPFDQFPDHVRRMRTYSWKPIIIRTLLMEFGWVFWADSSVRFTTSQMERALEYSRKNSMLFFTYGPILSVARNTDIQTMRFLGEDPCKFREIGEVESTVLYHFDSVTKVVVDAMTACALNADCISPQGTAVKLSCNIKNTHDGRCHRFDQSVLGILLRRLFHARNDYPLVDEPIRIHVVKRGQSVRYFPD